MKAKIIVRGTSVQDVGYRLFLLEKAAALPGFEAINTAEGLAVTVEGRERNVKDFITLVKQERPPFARVSSMKTEKHAGVVMRLRDFRAQFSVEQLAKIATTGVEMRGDIKEMKGDTKEIKSNTEETKEGMKSMLSKQDETTSEVRGLRSDLRTWMEDRFTRLESDVRAIKEKVGLT